MVRSLRFDTKNGSGELLKRDCPIKRHLRVLMEVDGDEEEEGAHVFPILYAELLNGKCNVLMKAKLGPLDTWLCGQFEVKSEN